MKQIIALELARQLRRAAKVQDDDVILDFSDAEKLLDRLEKLEAVAEYSQAVVIANADAVHGDADIHQACWDLKNALAALDAKGSG